jgi:hypothetical protein
MYRVLTKQMINTMYKSQIASMGANPATNPFVALALANRQAFGFCDASVIGETTAIGKKTLPSCMYQIRNN